METKTKRKQTRKAIFVSPEIYAKFKKAALLDNRKYAAFLEILIELYNKKPQ